MLNRSEDTYSLVLYRNGTFVRQITQLARGEAIDFGHEAVRDGEASRFEVWNEYHDRLEVTG